MSCEADGRSSGHHHKAACQGGSHGIALLYNPMKTPHRVRLQGAVAPLLILIFGVGFCREASAQSDDFEDGNDVGWSHYQPLKDFGAGGSFTVSGGLYRLSAPASPAPAVLGPQRIGSLRPDKIYTRARVQADITGWRTNINQAFGLIGRAAKLGLGTTEGYTYNYNSVSGFHQINLVQGEQATRQVNESAFPLNPADRYRMVFILTGEILVGRLYSITNSSIPLHSVAGMDENFQGGISGVFAYALTADHALDTRYDNYAADEPGPVRATVLDATPAVGEAPADPIASVSVRLANLETSVVPGSVGFRIDDQDATFELLEEPMGYRLVHTPTTALSHKVPHKARLTFTDDTGVQTFDWVFGPPTVASTPVLLASEALDAPPAPVTGARLDAATRTFTVPVSGAARFFRVSDGTRRRWSRTTLSGDQIVLTFE